MVAPSIETTIEIAAPPERVWRTLTDFQRMPDWNPLIRAIDGTLEAGERLTVQIAPTGQKAMRFHPTVLVAEDARELRWRGSFLISGLFDGEHYFVLTPQGEGATRVMHGETFSGILAPLMMRGSILEATHHGFLAMNEALKRVVEAEQASVPRRREPSANIRIEEETPQRWPAIDALVRSVFGGDYEADLTEGLRNEGMAITAFVALDGDKVVGHVMLGKLAAEVDGRAVKAACLAPLSVDPAYRHQGIAANLVEQGIAALQARHYEAVFVLGDTSYYPRFGFSSAITRKFASPFPGEAFMALELVPGALAGDRGTVKYPKAFLLDA